MIPIIIPAYEPDQRLIGLLKELSEYPYGPVILVNDGSGSAYEDIFKAAKNLLSEKAILLTHEVNRTGIKNCISIYPGASAKSNRSRNSRFRRTAHEKINHECGRNDAAESGRPYPRRPYL